MINIGDGPFRESRYRKLVRDELRQAGVSHIIQEEKEIQVLDKDCPAAQTPPGIIIPSLERRYHYETHYKVWGKLCGWNLTRAWTYWIVSCEKIEDEIHASDAMALFEKHGTMMRVDGHCGCPPPEGNYLKNHSRVKCKTVEGGHDLFVDGKHYSFVPTPSTNVPEKQDHWIEVFKRLVEENPTPIGGINIYHIDTQDAFNAFCKYLNFRAAIREVAEEACRDERVKTGNWRLAYVPQLDKFIS